MAETQHRNFYNNNLHPNDIATAIDAVEGIVEDLEVIRAEGGRPFKAETEADQDRLEDLTNRRYSVGAESPNGFTDNWRRWRYRGQCSSDDGETTSGRQGYSIQYKPGQEPGPLSGTEASPPRRRTSARKRGNRKVGASNPRTVVNIREQG